MFKECKWIHRSCISLPQLLKVIDLKSRNHYKTSLGWPGPESWSRPETEKQEKQEKQTKHNEKQAKSKFCLLFFVFCLFCLFFLFSWARAGPQSWSRPETRKQEKQAKHRGKQTKSKFCLFFESTLSVAECIFITTNDVCDIDTDHKRLWANVIQMYISTQQHQQNMGEHPQFSNKNHYFKFLHFGEAFFG